MLQSDFLFCEKPNGWTTHQSGPDLPGFKEWLEEQLQQPLWVAHRLDRDTSGAMIFARTSAMAENLREAFGERRVKKIYHFITASRSNQAEFSIQNHLTYNNKRADIDEHSPVNAVTHFRRVKRSPFFELWEAHPETGRTHQIRKHASLAGLPILGDELYQGAPFVRLCLHASALAIAELGEFSSPLPRLFERLGLLRDRELSLSIDQISRAQMLYQFLAKPAEALLLANSAHWVLEKRGPVLELHWYKTHPPDARDLDRWSFVAHMLGAKLRLLQEQNRSQLDPAERKEWWLPDREGIPDRWLASESGLQFEQRLDQGLSSGLFLDQRAARQKILHIARNRRVLNLFSYTGGFGVAALKGGAQSLVQVDASATYLEWSKHNLAANNLTKAPVENFKADVFFFLERALKKGVPPFELIICDPPSSGRSSEGHFQLARDFERLLDLIKPLLSEGGILYFSWNLTTLSEAQVAKKLARIFPAEKFRIREDALAPVRHFWVESRSAEPCLRAP